MGVEIRDLTTDELAGAAVLLSGAFAPAGGYNALQHAVVYQETLTGLSDRLSQTILLGAIDEDTGGLVGSVEAFTPAFLEGKDVRFWNQNLPLETYVTALAVRRDSRNGGVAQALMRGIECRAWAAGEGTVSLQVDESNLAAAALYAKLGYEVVGREHATTTPCRYALVTSLLFGGRTERWLLTLQKARPPPPSAPPAAAAALGLFGRAKAKLKRLARLVMTADTPPLPPPPPPPSPPPPPPPPSLREALGQVVVDAVVRVDGDAARAAAEALIAPSWAELGGRLPEAERLKQVSDLPRPHTTSRELPRPPTTSRDLS